MSANACQVTLATRCCCPAVLVNAGDPPQTVQLGLSAEGERVSPDAWIQELDRKRPLGNGPALPDELVKPLLGDSPSPIDIDIRSVTVTGSRAVDRDAEADWPAVR
jgi:hypothetical protein